MNRERLLKRLNGLPAKSGHARVLRRKLGITDSPPVAPTPKKKVTKKKVTKKK